MHRIGHVPGRLCKGSSFESTAFTPSLNTKDNDRLLESDITKEHDCVLLLMPDESGERTQSRLGLASFQSSKGAGTR